MAEGVAEQLSGQELISNVWDLGQQLRSAVLQYPRARDILAEIAINDYDQRHPDRPRIMFSAGNKDCLLSLNGRIMTLGVGEPGAFLEPSTGHIEKNVSLNPDIKSENLTVEYSDDEGSYKNSSDAIAKTREVVKFLEESAPSS